MSKRKRKDKNIKDEGKTTETLSRLDTLNRIEILSAKKRKLQSEIRGIKKELLFHHDIEKSYSLAQKHIEFKELYPVKNRNVYGVDSNDNDEKEEEEEEERYQSPDIVHDVLMYIVQHTQSLDDAIALLLTTKYHSYLLGSNEFVIKILNYRLNNELQLLSKSGILHASLTRLPISDIHTTKYISNATKQEKIKMVTLLEMMNLLVYVTYDTINMPLGNIQVKDAYIMKVKEEEGGGEGNNDHYDLSTVKNLVDFMIEETVKSSISIFQSDKSTRLDKVSSIQFKRKTLTPFESLLINVGCCYVNDGKTLINLNDYVTRCGYRIMCFTSRSNGLLSESFRFLLPSLSPQNIDNNIIKISTISKLESIDLLRTSRKSERIFGGNGLYVYQRVRGAEEFQEIQHMKIVELDKEFRKLYLRSDYKEEEEEEEEEVQSEDLSNEDLYVEIKQKNF